MSEKPKSKIKTAFFLNLFFSVIELVGGIFTNSISIISDSIHDFGDAISIGIAMILEKKSERKPDSKYTFGYLRYSVLGALITSVVLLVGSAIALYNAIPRLINPVAVNYDGMLILAVLGLVINGIGAYTASKGEKVNEKVVSLHLLEDVLGWAAVLIVSLCIKIFNCSILDPILSLFITVFILVHVVRNMKEIFEIFLEKAPDDINFDEIKEELLENKSVKDIHHIHLWTADGISKYVTMHVSVSDDIKKEDMIALKKYINEELKEHKIEHATIEFEFESEICSNHECSISEHHEEGHHHHHHHHHH